MLRYLCLVLCLTCCPSEGAPNRRRNGNQQQRPSEICVDMTRTLSEGMIHFPTLHEFRMNITTKDVVDVKLQIEVIETATHMGTHMDAPRHFNANGITVDEIPLQNFHNVPAAVVDVRNKTRDNPEYQVDVSDLEAWEAAHGPFPTGGLVLLRTGWGQRWPDPQAFLGTDKKDDPSALKFPGLGALAATWLAQRPLAGVGTECISIDPNGEKTKSAHRTILGSPNKLYILENLANLDQLPEKGAKIDAFPIKIGNGSGAPSRVIGCFRPKVVRTGGRSSERSGRRRQ